MLVPGLPSPKKGHGDVVTIVVVGNVADGLAFGEVFEARANSPKQFMNDTELLMQKVIFGDFFLCTTQSKRQS